jgi:hypothetical protein
MNTLKRPTDVGLFFIDGWFVRNGGGSKDLYFQHSAEYNIEKLLYKNW